jgi:hypothetical protein
MFLEFKGLWINSANLIFARHESGVVTFYTRDNFGPEANGTAEELREFMQRLNALGCQPAAPPATSPYTPCQPWQPGTIEPVAPWQTPVVTCISTETDFGVVSRI